MAKYEPELGQMLFGNPVGEYELPEFVCALLTHILGEIERVYWNLHQQQWDQYADPGLPGITYRPYWWGTEDAPGAALPNFAFGEVHLRWYKHPGRGMSCNVSWTERHWREWFNACLKAIRAADVDDFAPGIDGEGKDG